MSKPVHPATVHFPIAFLSLAYTLDILNHVRPAALTAYLPTANESSRAATYLLALGLLSAIPAVLSGGQQALQMVSKAGMYNEQGVIRPKVKAVISHALLSDAVIATTAYIWWLRRAAGPTAETWMVAVEGLLLAGVVVTGGIGGTLTYNFGVGMDLGKVGGAGKKQQ